MFHFGFLNVKNFSVAVFAFYKKKFLNKQHELKNIILKDIPIPHTINPPAQTASIGLYFCVLIFRDVFKIWKIASAKILYGFVSFLYVVFSYLKIIK